MGMINCPNCGETISDKAAACPRCGSNVPKGNMIVCGECKTEYESSSPACPKCGCPRQRVEVKAQKKEAYRGNRCRNCGSADCRRGARIRHIPEGKGIRIL